MGLAVLKEELEDFDEVFGFGEVAVEGDAVVLVGDAVVLVGDAVVLVEDGAVGGLEEDIGEGVAFGYFGLDLLLQVVGGVFGLPEAMDEGEFVDQCAVCAERLFAGAFELVLLDEVPVIGAGALSQQVGEGGASVLPSVVWPCWWNWARAA